MYVYLYVIDYLLIVQHYEFLFANKRIWTYIERIAEQTEVFDPDKPVWHSTQVHQESTEYLQ